MALSPLNTKCSDNKLNLQSSNSSTWLSTPNSQRQWDEKSSSPASTCSSPEFTGLTPSSRTLSSSGGENRRGRPRAEALTNLMIVGSTSPSAIKCDFCKRVFPREKSLQAHLRTHTGERPYACDYPGCLRAFTQSGQLRTHQRLHTGEKPFVCSAPGCGARFTHANRHCTEHPQHTLLRCPDNINSINNNNDIQSSSPSSTQSSSSSSFLYLAALSPAAAANARSHSHEIMQWLEKYHREKDRSPSTRAYQVIKKRVKYKSSLKHDNCDTMLDNNQKQYQQRAPLSEISSRLNLHTNYVSSSSPTNLQFQTNLTPNKCITSTFGKENNTTTAFKTPVKSLNDENLTPRRVMTEQPKKRWLREAFQDASLRSDSDEKNNQRVEESLAQPIHWGNDTDDDNTRCSPISNSIQQRPTVLVWSSTSVDIKQETTSPSSSSSSSSPKRQSFTTLNLPLTDENKWLGAMALMELATVRPVSTCTINNDSTSTLH